MLGWIGFKSPYSGHWYKGKFKVPLKILQIRLCLVSRSSLLGFIMVNSKAFQPTKQFWKLIFLVKKCRYEEIFCYCCVVMITLSKLPLILNESTSMARGHGWLYCLCCFMKCFRICRFIWDTLVVKGWQMFDMPFPSLNFFKIQTKSSKRFSKLLSIFHSRWWDLKEGLNQFLLCLLGFFFMHSCIWRKENKTRLFLHFCQFYLEKWV